MVDQDTNSLDRPYRPSHVRPSSYNQQQQQQEQDSFEDLDGDKPFYDESPNISGKKTNVLCFVYLQLSSDLKESEKRIFCLLSDIYYIRCTHNFINNKK